MDTSVVPADERERLAAVRRYEILDTPPDGSFDRVTALAARLLGVPIAIVSIVDESRIWFKSHHGVDVDEVGRDPGLCASCILEDRPWLVSDAVSDPRALANPLVAGELGLRFYAGVPLRTTDGFNLGTLCVIDREPRDITEGEVATLVDLAGVVMDELELRLSARAAVSREAGLRRRAENVAASLQRSLIPPSMPRIDGLELVSRYHVAHPDVVGGDFFDVAPADWGTALLVGDACGKGTAAAAAAAMGRWTLRALLSTDPDPAAALRELNRQLLRTRLPLLPDDPVKGTAPAAATDPRYLTAAAVTLRRAWGQTEITVSLGGHPRPLLLRTDGTVQAVGTTGPIIGWFDDADYGRGEAATLAPGDALVVYTDGLVEGLAAAEEERSGALTGLLSPLGGCDAEEIAAALDAALPEHREDDAAFVVARSA